MDERREPTWVGGPGSPGRLVTLMLATCVSAWSAAGSATGWGDPPPVSPPVPAERLEADPALVAALSADLHISLKHQDGEVLTIAGLANLQSAASDTGARGRAARAALVQLDAAILILDRQGPATADDVRYIARVRGLTATEALTNHVGDSPRP